MSKSVSMNVNGQAVGPIEVSDQTMMIELLHEKLNLTGTKFGCGAGVCHACVVIVDNDDGTSTVERTCIKGAGYFDGKKVRTIEGHAKTNEQGEVTALSPVQQAFLEHFSFQCGWCTSGFVNTATALVERLAANPISMDKLEETIDKALENNVCRCTGYVKYFEAVKDLITQTPGLIK